MTFQQARRSPLPYPNARFATPASHVAATGKIASVKS